MLSAITPSFLQTSPVPSTSLSIPNAKWLMEEVVRSRQEHAALEAAIRQHEADSLAPSTVTPPNTPRLKQSGGGGGGRGRGGGKSGRVNKNDLRLKPPTANSVPNSVPKNINNKIYFNRVTVRTTQSNSTTVITEANYSWNLQLNPDHAALASIFDQWAVVQASVRWSSLNSPSFTGTVPELHTAIDFDNSTNLGSITALDDYGTSQLDTLIFNKSVTRSVKPCIKPDVNAGTGNVVGRAWCDSATQTTLWFGIRSILGQAATTATTLLIDQEIWFAFRNPI